MQVESDTPSVHDRVESVLTAIGGDDAPDTPDAPASTGRDERGRFASTREAPAEETTTDSPDADATDEVALDADENTADTDADEVEADAPPVEPPPFLSDELKARFATFPPDVQRDIARYEQERDQGVNRKLSEAAETRKAAEAERAQAAQERQRYAQAIDHALSLANVSPVIQAGLQTDWLKLAREDKAAYVEKRAEFDAAVQQHQHLQAQRAELAQAQHAETVQAEVAKAIDVMPELKDPAKRKEFATGVQSTLKDYGFSDAEIANVADHRILRVLRDVIAYRAGEKARKAAAEKATRPVPNTTKPARGGEAADTREARNAAMLKRAKTARTAMDKAAAIAAMLD